MRWMGWIFGVVVSLTVMTGCVPERVVWSPDGTQAAILGDDGLHICDVDGKIGSVIVLGGQPLQAKVVEWLPDGKRLVAIHDEKLATWKEVAAGLPEQAKAVLGNSQKIAETREALVRAANAGGTMDDFVKAIPQDAATMYLRDTETEALREKLGKRWQALADWTVPVEVARVYTLRADGADVGPALWHGETNTIYTLRVSPTGKAVLIAGAEGDPGQKSDLVVVAVDGLATRDLGEGSLYPDWSADGKSVVYIKPWGARSDNADEARLGMLERVQVLDDAGTIIAAGAAAPKEESLVGVLFDDGCRVRVAKDGRLFFIASEIALPATPADVNTKPVLFSIDPGRQATVARVVPRGSEGDLGDAPQLFELSPDGMRMSVPFKDGRVSVVNLGDGTVEQVQPLEIGKDDKSFDRLTSVPVWRTAEELTFVRPKEEYGRSAEVVRYSVVKKSVVVMSGSWPAEVAKSWLPPATPSTNP